MGKAIIKLGYSCNNNCMFCHALDKRLNKDISEEEARRKIRLAKIIGMDCVILSGGEPTMRKDFIKLASYVKKCGMGLGVITNGRMFSSPKLIKSAVKCGLSFAYMSLHGDREVHNELTRGDFFDQTVSGIRNASRAVPNGTVVNCVVNRMNLERLRDVADICRDLGCRTVKFSNLTMEGAAIENSARLAVSLEKSVTAVTDAMNYAISLGMDARFDGFPLCMMGKLRKSLDNLRTNGITHMSESFETELYPTDCGNYSRSGDACMTCAVEECCGIDKKYSSFFGKPKLMPLGLV